MAKRLLYGMIAACFLLLLPASAAQTSSVVAIDVPFVTQIPYGSWYAPWSSACEEASIVMVEQYYQGRRVLTLPKEEAASRMNRYHTVQYKRYGTHRDSSAERTAEIIAVYAESFTARTVDNPTLIAIQEELRNKRPVITVHYGRQLTQTVPFSTNGSAYHMIVLVGFDDNRREFIVHEPGMFAGAFHRYSYEAVINSLHDYDHQTDTADEPARALFTEPKTTSSGKAAYDYVLAKGPASNHVYLIHDGRKYYISHPRVFTARGWQWHAVHIVSQGLLDELPHGGRIDV